MRSKEVEDLCLHGRNRWWPDVLRAGVTWGVTMVHLSFSGQFGGSWDEPSSPHFSLKLCFLIDKHPLQLEASLTYCER